MVFYHFLWECLDGFSYNLKFLLSESGCSGFEDVQYGISSFFMGMFRLIFLSLKIPASHQKSNPVNPLRGCLRSVIFDRDSPLLRLPYIPNNQVAI